MAFWYSSKVILRILFFKIAKTFSNTNWEMSMLLKREKRSVAVEVCSSKMFMLHVKALY